VRAGLGVAGGDCNMSTEADAIFRKVRGPVVNTRIRRGRPGCRRWCPTGLGTPRPSPGQCPPYILPGPARRFRWRISPAAPVSDRVRAGRSRLTILGGCGGDGVRASHRRPSTAFQHLDGLCLPRQAATRWSSPTFRAEGGHRLHHTSRRHDLVDRNDHSPSTTGRGAIQTNGNTVQFTGRNGSRDEKNPKETTSPRAMPHSRIRSAADGRPRP